MRGILLSLLLSLTAQFAFAVEPPAGWRAPTAKELAAEPLRKESPTKSAEVIGDFNGDGIQDHAYLFKSTKFSGEGLAVMLSFPKGFVWKIIDQTDWGKEYPNVDLAMGIDLAKPGDYKTACAKGYWECDQNEPEVLKLKTPGIWHFRFESAASIWYWDMKGSQFKQVWISD
jgi:hypothetical protein